MCYVEDVYHVPCGHWADRPRIYHRCVGAPDQPLDQLHTVPSLPRLEAQVGKYREHGDPKLPKPGMRMSTPCTNAVTRGPAKDEHNKCGRCRIDVEKIVSNQTEDNDTTTYAKVVVLSCNNIRLCTAVNEPTRVLSVSDWQSPPTRFNPFDDDATTLVDSSKSDCPSEYAQSHDGEKQYIHELPNERKAEPVAEHKKVARRFLHICIDKLKTLRIKRNTFYTDEIEGVGTWYDPYSIGPLEKVPGLGEKTSTTRDSCVVQ